MHVPEKSKDKPPGKSKKGTFRLILLAVIALIVLAFLLAPMFVSSEKGRQIILAKINSSLDGQADFAGLSMGWMKGIRFTDISFNNSSGLISVAVKQITIKPRYRSILLGKLSFKAKLDFEQAEYMGLRFGSTEVDVQMRNGILKIEPFSTTVNNGQFNFVGEVDFNQKPTLLKTQGPVQIVEDIQINDDMSRRLLAYLNPVFANAFNVSGVGNFNCERLAIPLAETAGNDLEVIGTIRLDRLHLQSSDLLNQILSLAGAAGIDQYITIHPTRFVLRDGFLRYDDMQMDVGDNPVNFKGVIGLDKSLDMRVTLPYTTAGRTARVGKETVGERITLPLKGTLDKPEIDLGKLLEEQLWQQLREKISEGLEKLFK